jgi:hypothetical protein
VLWHVKPRVARRRRAGIAIRQLAQWVQSLLHDLRYVL